MSFARRLVTLLLLSFCAVAGHAATVNVGPGQAYPKIQAGIDAAAAGDVVMVAPGIYYENIDFKGKAITVTSSGGTAVTIIDGGGVVGTGTVNFQSGELRTSVISGFTIRGGGGQATPNGSGGGVHVYQSAPTVLSNAITANTCDNVLINSGAPLLLGNSIYAAVLPVSGYPCTYAGAGVLVNGNATVGAYTHTEILTNLIGNHLGPDGEGIVLNAADGTVVQGNTIRGNAGYNAGGISMYNTNAVTILQNLFYGNVLRNRNGGAGTPNGMTLLAPFSTVGPFVGVIAGNTFADGLSLDGNLAQFLVINNIISTSSATAAALQCGYTNALAITPPSFDHNDVYNSAGPAYGPGCPDQTGTYGNLSAEPLFASANTADYQLTAKSPVLDAGNNSAPGLPATDFAGAARVQIATNLPYGVVDLGAFEYLGAADHGRTTVTLTPSEYFGSANPSPAPPPLALTVVLSSVAGQPTGQTAIYEDGTLLGVVSVGSSGMATLTPGNLASGTHSFTAVYPASNSGTVNAPAYFTPAVSPRLFLLVPKSATTLTLGSTPSPSGYGSSVTFTLNTNASGPVTLTDSSTNTLLATLTPNAQGLATYSTAGLGGGTHTIVATVAASGTQSGGSATVQQVVAPAPTLARVVATATAVGGGHLTGTLTGTITSPVTYMPTGATGTVTFYANGVALGSPVAVNVFSGQASINFSLMQGVRYSMTCVYGGDNNYAGSTSYPEIVSSSPPTNIISFPTMQANSYAATAVALTATASSGLPVTYTVVSGPATVSGTTLTYTGAGPVVVEADQAGDTTYPAAMPVQRTINVTLLTQTLTQTSNPVATLITFLQSGTVQTITVSTQGASGLDFNLAAPGNAGGNCQTGVTYAAGQTCQAFFTFTPQHPGLRYGGIALADSTGALLANSYLLGLGTGPQVLYNPPTQTAIGTGFGGLSGVAVDGAGNIYASDYTRGGVYQISAATGTTRQLTPNAASVLTMPATDVAVDGSGNVFYTTRSILAEILAVNGAIPANPTVRVVATGFGTSIDGMKVDATGNVFIASAFSNGTNSYIEEVLAVNGSIPANPVIRTLVSGVGQPTGVAIDVAGNVYFSEEGGNNVYEIVAVGGTIPVNPTLRIVATFGDPTNVAFDVSGNLYVPDVKSHDVKELLAVNLVLPASPTIVSLGAGLSVPSGVFIDAAGSLYVADENVLQVVKLAYGSAPTLTFAATQVGQTSADSPRTVTITNGGNAPLNIPPPASGTNPAITTNFSLAPGASCPVLTPGAPASGLAAGASCTTAVSFSPATVGNLTGTLVRTDDNLGVPGATQTILLNGVGLGIPPTIVFNVANKTFGDPPFTVGATSNSPGAFTYRVVSGPATIAGTTVTLTGGGSVTLQASQAASGTYAAGSATATFTVAQRAQTINFIAPATPVAFTSGPIALVATASSGLPVSFSIVSGPGQVSGSTLTVKGGGTIVIAADQAGDTNYAAAPRVTRTVMVLYGLATVTLTGSPNPVFLRNPVVLTAAVSAASGTPTGTVTFLEGRTVLGVATVGGGGASISVSTLGVGSHTITASYGGDGNYAVALSNSIVILVQDFSLTIANPDVTIQHGGTAVYNLVVSSVGGVGLASTIQLTFSGGPERSVSTLTPVTVAAGSGITAATLTMHTPNYPAGPFVLAGLLGLLLAPLRRRGKRLRGLLMLMAVLVGLGSVSGCGSGWKAQRFDVTVTATSGQLVRSAQATLISRP